MRRFLPLLVALVLAAAMPATASAATTVKATGSNTFSPSSVSISRGSTVTWVIEAGFHDADIERPTAYLRTNARSTGTIGSKTFHAGTFTFFCSVHPGMTGRVYARVGLSRSGSSVTVSLGSVPTTHRHVVQRRKSTSTTWSSVSTTAGADTRTFSGLSSGTWYFQAKLVKISDGTASAYSPVSSVTVP